MNVVQIDGWRPGFAKVEHTKALRSVGLGLAEAKSITDAVMLGERPVVEVRSRAEAEVLVARLNELGANATLLE